MSDLNHEINLQLRTAAGHMRAAQDAEAEGAKQYEMKMKSAGAATYGAFVLAARAAPEYAGRKIDDKAVARIYDSNKPRPWWDEHLAKVKFQGATLTREIAKRAIQWHLDPDAAKARKAKAALNDAAQRKRLKEQQNRTSRGVHTPQRQETVSARNAAHSDRITAASTNAALAGREAPKLESKAVVHATRDDLLGEVNRIKVAIGRLKTPEQLDEAFEVLKTTAREIEGYL